ncbi:MAG: ATP-dependent Clp protease proteolytic subunit [Pseudomonadota bacterium]
MSERYKQDLDEEGIYYLTGTINMSSVAEPIRWVLRENFNRNHKKLTLIINSNGGELSAAFALIDVMRGSSIPIHTIGLGRIASSGLLIFASGEKGHRVVTPNTSILSHQWSGGSYGKEHDLVARFKEHDMVTDRMLKHYAKCTGLEPKKIRKRLLPPTDVWLTPKEARKLNLCDKIKDIG